MFFLPNTRNWFAVSVIKAVELRSDLRLYKKEKALASEVDDFKESATQQNNQSETSPFDRDEEKSIYKKLTRDGTIQNNVLKSVLGFFGGLKLTYVCFLFLIYSLNFTLGRATLICVCLAAVLSLGLAFSVRTRCTVLLCLPQLFSKRGRQALLAYAFILALSGPAKNTLHNIEVMSESLACGQEQLKRAESEVVKCVHSPNAAAKQSLDALMAKMDVAVSGYKKFFDSFYKNSNSVIEAIIGAREWLYSVSVLCNEKMGSPFGRCTDLLFKEQKNCKGVYDSENWNSACDVSALHDYICYAQDDPICSVDDLPPFWPFLNHRAQLKDFIDEAMNVVWVRIEGQRVMTAPNRTTALHEEYQGMATEIRQKTDQFLQYFDLMSLIFGVFIVVLFIKYKFLTEDEYDNRFITSDFVNIDRTRAEFGMERLMPLNTREQNRYIKVTSLRLVPYERRRLLSSFAFLFFATFKIVIHILTDCSLHWMLSTMRKHSRMLLSVVDEDRQLTTLTVNGTGIFAELLRNLTTIVKSLATVRMFDPVPCLPDPIPPDWNRYYQILTLVGICWVLAFLEPYGLRLRHMIMVTYHPDRARERAIWLYNRILTTRINFVKFARRQLRRKYKDMDEDVFNRKRCWVIKRRRKCLLCGTANEELKKCSTPGCVGIYCKNCFETLQLCSICRDPSTYDDYSDVSEEKDSEEETGSRCSVCGGLTRSRTSLAAEPFHAIKRKIPTLMLSAVSKTPEDTIVDVNRFNVEPVKERLPEGKLSIFARLVARLNKVFSLRAAESKETNVRKSENETKRKKSKLKEIFVRTTKKQPKMAHDQFKNVYFVEIDRATGKIRRSFKNQDSAVQTNQERITPGRTRNNSISDDQSSSSEQFTLPVCPHRKNFWPLTSSSSSNCGTKLEGNGRRSLRGVNMYQTRGCRRVDPRKKRQRWKRTARSKRRYGEKYETSSDSSGPGKSRKAKSKASLKVADADVLTTAAQKVVSKRAETLKAKLARFFRRSIKRRNWSDEECEYSSEENLLLQPETSGGKRIPPDLLSDLPSSRIKSNAESDR